MLRKLLAGLWILCCLAGCADQQKNQADPTAALEGQLLALTEENTELKEQVQRLEAEALEATALRDHLEKVTEQRNLAQEARLALTRELRELKTGQESPSVVQKESPVPHFTDVDDGFAGPKIQQLASLGVFGPDGGEFQPHQPLTRATYVRWAVRAFNAAHGDQPDRLIHLAETGPATFADVAEDHPDFRYIQGLQNSGFVVGYDATTFQPDRILSREEMIAIKTSIDGFTRDYGGFNEVMFADRDDISEKYRRAFHCEMTNGYPNIYKAFGKIKTLRPQAQVTRAEAAASIWSFGGSWTGVVSIEQALES